MTGRYGHESACRGIAAADWTTVLDDNFPSAAPEDCTAIGSRLLTQDGRGQCADMMRHYRPETSLRLNDPPRRKPARRVLHLIDDLAVVPADLNHH
jgi:hypothetical protein